MQTSLELQSLDSKVLDLIAETTRYPKELLLPDAKLEEDLGIDSVKRAEIWIVVQDRLQLPEQDVELPMKTIQDVIDAVNGLAAPAFEGSEQSGASTEIHNSTIPESNQERLPQLASPPNADLLDDKVIDIVSEVTRYPRSLLTPDAFLENDLGIDSVKQAEIWIVLQDRLSLDDRDNDSGTFRTVRDVLDAVRSLANTPEPPHDKVKDWSTPQSRTTPTPNCVATVTSHVFAGKRAFVTGSGHGLGRVIARKLAEAGAEVIVNSFHSRDLGEQLCLELQAAGHKAEHLWGSVANPDQLESMFGELKGRYENIDFFISNASNGFVGPMSDVTPDHWDLAFRTNVVALHQGALAAAKLMPMGGRIVTLSSPGAQRCFDHYGCMGPVKAAVESLVRYLALELGSQNISVNAVCPGPIYGELLSSYPDHETLIPYWESRTPNNLLVTEEEIADVVLFLLSPEARSVNGITVPADRGLSLKI